MQQRPQPSAGALIGGLAVGLVAGGSFLWLIPLFVGAFVQTSLDAFQGLPFIVSYVVAAGVGALAFFLRKGNSFLLGFLIGTSIGMLGSTALCNGVVTGFSNH